jgi:hypothetical protein
MSYFKDLVDVTIDGEKCSDIVVCAGTDARMITTCAYLIGSYLILRTDSTFNDVATAFQPVADRFERFKDNTEPDDTEEELTIFDCWEALQCGKVQGWLDFTSETPDLDRCIDMEEYMHYDNPANGKLHVVIPSRLIAFPCPSDLEVDEETGEAPQWVDTAGKRHFGPDYYADVLGDFDVQLVVRCDASVAYDDAFTSRGLAVERLGGDLELQPQRLLQEVDRFLTLARLVPGMIGIHGEDVGLGGGGEMLLSSLLIKRHGFRARSALAWLRITHPAVDAQPALRFSVLPHNHPSAVRPTAAPGSALLHRSAADLRCPPSADSDSPLCAASLPRCASAPAALDELGAWDAIAAGEGGPAWARVPEPAVFDSDALNGPLNGAYLH